MVHTETIIRDAEVNYSGTFDLKEFLSVVKKFFGRYDYDLDEKLYETKPKDDLKSTFIRWNFSRRLDDYNKGSIRLEIKLDNYEEARIEGKKVVKGNLKLKINSEVIRDYEDKWKKSPIEKFFRAIYDLYIGREREDKVSKSVKELTENFRTEIKKYFNV